MKTYSKPSADIQGESFAISQVDDALLDEQLTVSQQLSQFKTRHHCLLCNQSILLSPKFTHREIPYYCCEHCEHVQASVIVPDDFPASMQPKNLSYDSIYVQPSEKEFLSRVKRVYKPKLDWALEQLTCFEPEASLKKKSWVELGSGAGYFLKALQQQGFSKFKGFEQNQLLVKESHAFLPKEVVQLATLNPKDISTLNADVIVAFFVLEHIGNVQAFWQQLSKVKPGTLFIFSVPTFGLSTMIESAFSSHAARNLDNGLHTQLYTETSIDYALKVSGFKKLSTWYFGQDAIDLTRLVSKNISNRYEPQLLKKFQSNLAELVDPLQAAIDKAHFCDARHIIAIRES